MMFEGEFVNRLPDTADQATAIEERDRHYAMERRQQEREKELKEIEARKTSGVDHVYCETCGIEIPEMRIKAVPHATQCITCKDISEKEERRFM